MKNKPLITIVGETASGKSSLAMEIARRHHGEIISADSWQIYKHMNIGTAKPSAQEQAEVPHHCIDIVEPTQDFTAAQYKQCALDAMEDIHERGKLPILVGGTGLYVDAVLFDFSFLPAGSEEQRERLNAKSIDELLEIIAEKGYSLEGVDTRNKRRLIRLIETEGAAPTRSKLRENTLVIGIKRSRSQMRKRIEQRIDSMMAHGLKYEVQSLADRYGWEVESMKGIGYREWQPYVEGSQSRAETGRKIFKSTLELAKRQRTWFKRNRHIRWFEDTDAALESVENYLKSQSL